MKWPMAWEENRKSERQGTRDKKRSETVSVKQRLQNVSGNFQTRLLSAASLPKLCIPWPTSFLVCSLLRLVPSSWLPSC